MWNFHFIHDDLSNEHHLGSLAPGGDADNKKKAIPKPAMQIARR